MDPSKRTQLENQKLGARLREFRKSRGFSMVELARELEVSQPAISQWETGREPPGRQSITKLAKVLGVSISTLLGEADAFGTAPYFGAGPQGMNAMPLDVPLYGTVVGGSDGDFRFNGDVVDYVRRPPGVVKMRNLYALWVQGNSMSPWNNHGDLIYVTPSRPPVPGDYVVVEFVGGAENEPGMAMVKLLTGKTATQLKLKQYNPEKEFTVPLSKVRSVHRVLNLRDLLGA